MRKFFGILISPIFLLNLSCFSFFHGEDLKDAQEEWFDKFDLNDTSDESLEAPAPKNDDSDKLAEEAFDKHFENMMAGYAEGAYFVLKDQASVFKAASSSSSIVTRLPKGESLHVLEIQQDWARIGKSQFIRLTDIQSRGLSTFPPSR